MPAHISLVGTRLLSWFAMESSQMTLKKSLMNFFEVTQKENSIFFKPAIQNVTDDPKEHF